MLSVSLAQAGGADSTQISRQLIARAQKGDAEAREALAVVLNRELKARAQRVPAAEDVRAEAIQRVLLRLHVGGYQLDPDNNIPGYLSRSVRLEIRNIQYGTKGTRRTGSLSSGDEGRSENDYLADPKGPDSVLSTLGLEDIMADNQEVARLVHELVLRMPEPARSVLQFRLLDGQDQNTTIAHLGIGRRRFQKWDKLAMTRLRSALAPLVAVGPEGHLSVVRAQPSLFTEVLARVLRTRRSRIRIPLQKGDVRRVLESLVGELSGDTKKVAHGRFVLGHLPQRITRQHGISVQMVRIRANQAADHIIARLAQLGPAAGLGTRWTLLLRLDSILGKQEARERLRGRAATAMRDEIAHLNDRHQEVARMRFVDGMSITEIRRATKLSKQAIATLLKTANERLRARLETDASGWDRAADTPPEASALEATAASHPIADRIQRLTNAHKAAPPLSPEERAVWNEAIRQLPRSMRRVARLRWVRGLTRAEVHAKVPGQSLDALKMALRNSKRILLAQSETAEVATKAVDRLARLQGKSRLPALVPRTDVHSFVMALVEELPKEDRVYAKLRYVEGLRREEVVKRGPHGEKQNRRRLARAEAAFLEALRVKLGPPTRKNFAQRLDVRLLLDSRATKKLPPLKERDPTLAKDVEALVPELTTGQQETVRMRLLDGRPLGQTATRTGLRRSSLDSFLRGGVASMKRLTAERAGVSPDVAAEDRAIAFVEHPPTSKTEPLKKRDPAAAKVIESHLGDFVPRTRSILRMRLIHAKSRADIQSRFGITENAVKLTLRHARKKLARVIKARR